VSLDKGLCPRQYPLVDIWNVELPTEVCVIGVLSNDGQTGVSADLGSNGPPVHPVLAKINGSLASGTAEMGADARRTSALVTEWSQNWGHCAKLSY
jgi:hypothetical protein